MVGKRGWPSSDGDGRRPDHSACADGECPLYNYWVPETESDYVPGAMASARLPKGKLRRVGRYVSTGGIREQSKTPPKDTKQRDVLERHVKNLFCSSEK